VEWRAALDQLRSELSTQPAVTGRFTFATRRTAPASDPRLWVNPDVTLISAYERLTGGRGREVPATPVISDDTTKPEKGGKSAVSATGEND
jgi:hypothetical protein